LQNLDVNIVWIYSESYILLFSMKRLYSNFLSRSGPSHGKEIRSM
jgi:hypothetical protein